MYLMIVSSHTAPRPLVLQMISRPYINLALDSLLNEPRAHQVLTMPGEGEAVPAEVEALRRSGREFLKLPHPLQGNRWEKTHQAAEGVLSMHDGHRCRRQSYLWPRIPGPPIPTSRIRPNEWGLHPSGHPDAGCMYVPRY